MYYCNVHREGNLRAHLMLCEWFFSS